MDHGIATGTQSTVLLTDTNKTGTFVASVPSGSTTMTVSTASTTTLLQPNVMAITGTSIQAGTVIAEQLTGTPGGVGTYRLNLPATALISGATLNHNWVVNIFAGRKCKMIGGTGQSQEFTITSNTANTLVMGAITTAPVTLISSYAIIQPPVRGAGIELNWSWGMSDATKRGKYMFIARGGAALGFDRLDLTTDKWELLAITPQIETLTTGSMYAYDGGDRFYFTKEVTQRVYYIDINTSTIHGAGIYPYTAGAAILGNRMEIFTTSDGLKYLWLNRHSNLECFRCLLFY